MIKILNSIFERQAILKNVINPNRFEEINGENTLVFSAVLDEKTSEYVDEDAIVELDDDYFDIAYLKKNQNADGTLTIEVEAEHISYRLNDPDYEVEYFTEIGTPTEILGAILDGTGFTVGTVEFSDSMTYSIQEKKSRRMMVMELAMLLGGEVDYDKLTVSILQHRGSQEPKLLIKGKNIKVASKIVNKRERDKDGNYLVSYTCEPLMMPDAPLTLGDEVKLIQGDLDINEQLRIVRIGYNPYNPVEAEIELANFVSGLEDDIYRIETSTVVKDKLYYGARIGPEFGFESVRSDMLARAFFNADNFKMQSGDGEGNWTDELYFDPVTKRYYFNGILTANAVEAINANIDLIISQTVITQALYSELGYVAQIAVDQVDTSWQKINKYKLRYDDDYEENPDKQAESLGPVNYLKIYEQNIEFITGTVKYEEGSPLTEQAVDRFNRLLYWADNEYKTVTYEENDKPVMIYQYDELVKAKITFELNPSSGEYEVKIILGTGFGSVVYPDRGKAFIEKDTEGLIIRYVRANGTEEFIRLGENGNTQSHDVLTAMRFFTNGFIAEYGGASVGYRWTKDIDGRITQLENIYTDEVVPVTWNGGAI